MESVEAEPVVEKPQNVRELHITYDIEKAMVEVRGHVLDKYTCLQMLAEAGHIIIGLAVPAGKPH